MTTAQTARDALAAVGGLVTGADIARRWGVSRQWFNEMARRPDFPEPVYSSATFRLYLLDEVDAYRAEGADRDS